MAKGRPPTLSREEELDRLLKAQAKERAKEAKAAQLVRISRREGSLRDTDQATVVTATAQRVNRGEAPGDFDEGLGLIREWEGAINESIASQADVERLVRLATDVIRRLGPVSQYCGHLPDATTLPDLKRLPTVPARSLRRALPALERLHRALFPGWRAFVLQWLEQVALEKIETRHRPLRSGPWVNLAPAREVPTAAGVLETLRANPREPVPVGLTEAALRFASELVVRSAGGIPGHTPEKTLELIEGWVQQPDTSEAMIKTARKTTAKRATRRAKLRGD
jgi:hypothetical protein